MQAEVLLLDLNIDRLRAVDQIYRGQIQTVASNAFEIERAVLGADLVIGAVLIPGAKAPTLLTNELVSRMKPGSVLVDISIDQGGCFEDSHPTTHAHPTYAVHNSVFYCVANMPGAVPNTSTHALTNVTLPYAVALASRNVPTVICRPEFATNTFKGSIATPDPRRMTLNRSMPLSASSCLSSLTVALARALSGSSALSLRFSDCCSRVSGSPIANQ